MCARADQTYSRDLDIVERLGAWYDAHARDLPWRRTSDAYSIWVSEVMLQQTRVETVIPYYRRFLERWADVRALAEAPLDDVLSAWAGLGYYRRARIMHATAREVTEHRGGRFPTEHAALRELGGIGEYTAGAVASIAGGERAALVDGNVARVLARVEGIAEDPRSSAGKKRLWAAAWRLVPAEKPGRFNQALMELGARVCAPQVPRCGECPLRGACVAERDGLTATLPAASPPKRARPRVALWAAVIRSGQRTLLMRRDPHGKSALFAGLWEPPMVEADGAEAAAIALRGLGVVTETALQQRGHVRHLLTHRELEVTVAVARARRDASVSPPAGGVYDRAEWVESGKGAHALSTLARRVLAAAEGTQSNA